MKLEFNGRVVAGFLLGAVCGVVATVAIAAGPIGRMQAQRDDLRTKLTVSEARAERLNDSARMFASQWVDALKASGQFGSAGGCIDQWDSSSCFNVSFGGGSSPVLPAVQSHPSAGPDPRFEAVVVAMYNKIRPGLGDAVKAFIEQHQSTVH